MTKLVCPSCRWDGSDEGAHGFCFRYLENVTSIRRVEGFNKEGVLIVASEERIDTEDAGTDARFECGNCLVEFPIPEGVTFEFV